MGTNAMRSLFVMAGIAALALNASNAAAQQQVSLEAYFYPDPHEVGVFSGGDRDAGRAFGGACVGMVSETPTVVVSFASNGGPLSFRIISNSQTSLVIKGPDGRVQCDDAADGSGPTVAWPSAPSGQFEVWIGAVGGASSGKLQISEVPA